MPPNYSNPYSSEFEIHGDHSVGFQCTRDAAALPWLTLPPHHPVVIQTQAYWTAVGASIALAGMEATQWSALTWIQWELGSADGGHAASGIYRRHMDEEHPSYEIELFNEADDPIVAMKGRGVIFRNRNFEKWREGSKAKARKAPAPVEFTFAGREELGLSENEFALVAPFETGSDHVEALVTKENGLAPGNPLIGGSGDHVNSTHFHEAARQALHLITGDPQLPPTGGEMEMMRYVELGTPFRLVIEAHSSSETVFALTQLERECARITLRA